MSIAAAAVFLAIGVGCSDAVKLVRDTGRGGVVTYSYKQDRGGHLGSPFRREALDLIQHRCGRGSRIIREGEAQGYTSAGMGTIEGTEDEIRGRRWAIQFECKDGTDLNTMMSERKESRNRHQLARPLTCRIGRVGVVGDVLALAGAVASGREVGR